LTVVDCGTLSRDTCRGVARAVPYAGQTMTSMPAESQAAMCSREEARPVVKPLEAFIGCGQVGGQLDPIVQDQNWLSSMMTVTTLPQNH
jgi:hypothetical protein